ncbi:hypothetical protein GCM10009827_063760 [Dactylosporangium maewongense]|uniref:Uncharacterized protein n=1 Tax=Dactylosporangium maewongense TaxID=634393 RepID=A0ABN2BBR1_9ACTN
MFFRCLSDGTLGSGRRLSPLDLAVLGGGQHYEGDDYVVAHVLVNEAVQVAAALETVDEAWRQLTDVRSCRYECSTLARVVAEGERPDKPRASDRADERSTGNGRRGVEPVGACTCADLNRLAVDTTSHPEG